MSLLEYAIRFYRSQEWADRFQRAGIYKPAGWVLSPVRYTNREEAAKTAHHLNKAGPKYPVELVILWNGEERTR